MTDGNSGDPTNGTAKPHEVNDHPPTHSCPDGDREGPLRQAMIDDITGQGVASDKVLAVMARVPRHLFVPDHELDAAYANRPLPIGADQTISQPLVVAWMASQAHISSEARVLEVGTGSGYGAAVLGGLAEWVVSTERIGALATQARQALADAGVNNVEVIHTDGTAGWVKGAPYDAIVVTAAAPAVPEPLVDQLAPGGRLVVPVGDRHSQQLVVAHRTNGGVEHTELGWVAFVPLVGRHGWRSA